MAKREIKKETGKLVGSGMFIPAGLFIGIGLGFLYSQIVAGTLLGLGIGFLLAGLFKFLMK
jgi:hypothetical protein